MGLHKGQTNNPNGRKVGSENVATTNLKIWVRGLLEKNIELFENDLIQLESKDRLNVLQGLLKFSIPTLASTTIEATIQAEYSELKKLLDEAPEDAIEAISQKILTLKNQNENE